MKNSTNNITTMAVDFKRRRLRIHKATIHRMGDPKYIQLLIDPDGMAVAIRAVENSVSGDQAHRVKQALMASDHSYEICSKLLMDKLVEIFKDLDVNSSYRLTGKIIEGQNAAVFSLKTLSRIEA